MRTFCAALVALSVQMAPVGAHPPFLDHARACAGPPCPTPQAALAPPLPSFPPAFLPMKVPMRFVIVRSAEAGCEPHCAEWISAEGDIFPGTAAEFSRALGALGNRKLPILINSRGGSSNDALAIGRMIRARRLDVAVTKTRFTSCEPGDAACQKSRDFVGFRGAPEARLAICASACAYLLAGGVNRYVGPTSFVGLHQSTIKRAEILTRFRVMTRQLADGSLQTTKTVVDKRLIDLGSAAQSSQGDYRAVSAYLEEMGVSAKELLDIVVATPASSIHWMTPTELLTTNLFTDRRNGEYLIAAANRAAREAYLASPEYRTIACAHALVPMGIFDERETKLGLNFSHRKNTPDVDLTIVATSGGALLPSAPIEVDLRLPGDKTFAALDAQPRRPDDALSVTIPVAAFCQLARDSMIRIAIAQTRRPWVQDATLYTDARRFPAMDALLTEACRK